MIQVIVSTSVDEHIVNPELNSTPIAVLEELGVSLINASVSLNGQTLSVTDLSATFEALHVREGDSVRLNCTVKYQGGNT